MAIRLRLKDGTDVESDSAEELVKFYHSYSQNGKAPVPKPVPGLMGKAPVIGTESIPENAAKLVRILLGARDGMTTVELAQKLGVSNPKGIGGFVTSLTKWASRHRLGDKKRLLSKTRRVGERGEKLRMMGLTGNFRRQIEEGKIPGLEPEK
jgi:hypothetical protein